jgi:two-component system invasion response regulator UvrY
MSGRKLQVLLVDDHAVVRGGLRLMLAQTDDMEVAGEAEDAEQAILT